MSSNNSNMWEATNDYSSFKLHGKIYPEDVEKFIGQLANIKLPYLKLNILLSTLKELAESERRLNSETVLKIKKAILIGEHVEFSSASRLSNESMGLTLLGIPKEFLAAQNLALSEDERTTIVELVEKKLEENIRSIMKIFKLESGEHKILETERIKQVPTLLDNFVNAHKSKELMYTFYNRYRNKILSFHQEIIRMTEMNRFLVEERVNKLNPCLIQSLKVVERHDELLRQASRFCSASIKKDIFTQETIDALNSINKRQEEEIEEKEDKIEVLKKQVAEYESLYPEGFESLLKEYLEVEKALKNARSTLKELKSQNHDDSNDLNV